MAKVKSFTSPLKVFHTMEELANLDKTVNAFLAGGEVTKVLSVSDTTVTDDSGAAIGVIRVVAYE